MPKPRNERPASGPSPITGASALDLSSRLHGRGRAPDRATLTFVRDHAVSRRPAAPMPTATTLQITGQVRPGQDAPTEIALDHQVTLVPITVAPADGFERACNLEVDDTAIGWVAYGRAGGSYGWVWGDQLACHGSFQFVAASRSAAVFCELLAAVRAGTVADARTAPDDDPAGAGVLGTELQPSTFRSRDRKSDGKASEAGLRPTRAGRWVSVQSGDAPGSISLR
jgi:hypothetical protein